MQAHKKRYGPTDRRSDVFDHLNECLLEFDCLLRTHVDQLAFETL